MLESCCTKYTYVLNENAAYNGHFGGSDHNYSHWLGLDLPGGIYRLRLISWLSFQLDADVERLIESSMLHLSTCDRVGDQGVLRLGQQHLGPDDTVKTEGDLRDKLVNLVSVRNLRHEPEALFSLFRQFMQRISLPRLIHFFDLVLPQLTPVQAPWADAGKTLWSCHHIRCLHHVDAFSKRPKVRISYFFFSHDIHHVRIQWDGHPLLLFTDPNVVLPCTTHEFQSQASHVTNQQHLQMGLRKGMAILLYYKVGEYQFQAVLITHESVLGRGRKGDHRLWKRVAPVTTEFAWLPPDIAWSFCSTALYPDEARIITSFLNRIWASLANILKQASWSSASSTLETPEVLMTWLCSPDAWRNLLLL